MERLVPIEIDPVVIKTTDGKERKFLLSAGGINRLKQRFKVTTVKDLLAADESAAVTVLYEAMLEKGDMTEEQFNDVLPYNPPHIVKAICMLFGASFPDPPPAAATQETPKAAVN